MGFSFGSLVASPLRRLGAAARRGGRRLRQQARRLLPQAVLLMYHRVADVRVDPWELAVSPAHFAEHMTLLREKYDVWPLAAYADRLGAGRPPHRAVVLTFDDGYIDNLTTAVPILEAEGLPATFFVPTGLLGHDASFWWDALADCILHRRSLPAPLLLHDPGAPTEAPLRLSPPPPHDHDGRARLHKRLWTLLSRRTPPHRAELLDQLCDATGTQRTAPPSRRILTASEVATLCQQPGMDVGAHAASHTPLHSLSPPAQRDELQQARHCLQALTGTAVPGLSYPNGAYDTTTLTIADECGFEHACTTAGGAATWDTNPLTLPRLHVRNICASDLDAQLSRLLL